MELNRIILDTFQAISIILVFVTVFFSVKYPIIVEIIREDVPKRKPIDYQKFINRIKQSFVVDCLPLLFLVSVSFYILLPLAVKIIRSGEILFWSYEVLTMAYLAITMWVFLLLLWVLNLTYKLITKFIQSR